MDSPQISSKRPGPASPSDRASRSQWQTVTLTLVHLRPLLLSADLLVPSGCLSHLARPISAKIVQALTILTI